MFLTCIRCVGVLCLFAVHVCIMLRHTRHTKPANEVSFAVLFGFICLFCKSLFVLCCGTSLDQSTRRVGDTWVRGFRQMFVVFDR